MNILFFLTPKTDVVSLMDTDSVYTVLETLKKYRYASVPILNEAGNYVGTVKEGVISVISLNSFIIILSFCRNPIFTAC